LTMNSRIVKLIDSFQRTFATAHIVDTGDHYEGTIDLEAAPPEVRALFAEFEEIVNGQMFSFLDEIQARIDALHVKAVFADGSEADVKDLQVFPATGDMSFKLAELPATGGKLSPR